METLDDNVVRLQAELQTERFGRACRWFESVGSTNSVAFAWAKEGARTGSLVVADFQDRGRGRFNRTWTSDPGRNLTFSVVIDPNELQSNLGLLPIAIALAVTETLAKNVEPHHPRIKWPNDIILTGKKVCGILIESSLPSRSTDRGGRVVAGVGLNVNQDRFPDEVAVTATSVYRVLGRQVDCIELLADVLASIENRYEELRAGRNAELIRRYEALMLGLNEPIRFARLEGGQSTEATILGLDVTGGLRVETNSGVEILTAGEVTVLSKPGLPQTKIARLPDQTSTSSS